MPWNAFEIDVDGERICFMTTVRGSLLVGAARDDGVVESIHRFRDDHKTHEFKLQGGEIWRRRSKTPVFERIALQFQDLLSLLDIPENDEEKVISILIEIAFDLSQAEEAFLDYAEMEDAAVSKCRDPNSKNTQTTAFVYKNPTLALKEIAEKILIRLIIGYRKLPDVVTIIVGREFTLGKNLVKDLASLLPVNHTEHGSLQYDNNWIKELYDLRGDIEHQRWEIFAFEASQVEGDAACHVKRCAVVVKSQGETPIDLAAYLEVTIDNMMTFIEEVVALAIAGKMPYPTRLVSLPETERAKRHHYRYVADLPRELTEKPPGGIHKDL